MKLFFSHKNFGWLWLSHTLAKLGDTFFTVGLMVTIFTLTGSALQTAGVLIATMVPQWLFGPVAGALVDRYPRQYVLIGSNIMRSLLVVSVLFGIGDEGIQLWFIYGMVAAMSTTNIFYDPARVAIIPALVPRTVLVRANSMIIATNQGALAFGYIVGGFLTTYLVLTDFVWIVLLLFMLAGLLLLLLKFERGSGRQTKPEKVPIFKSIRISFSYLRKNSLARALVIMETAEHVPHGIWTSALMLVFVENALNGSSVDWGYQNGAFYGGQLVGAIVAASAARWVGKWAGWSIISNTVISGILTILYAISINNFWAVLISFIFGPPFAIRDVAQDTLLQTKVDGQILGRIYALRAMLASLSFMVSGLIFASLADQISIRWIYLSGGGLYLLIALVALFSKSLRNSRID